MIHVEYNDTCGEKTKKTQKNIEYAPFDIFH